MLTIKLISKSHIQQQDTINQITQDKNANINSVENLNFKDKMVFYNSKQNY